MDLEVLLRGLFADIFSGRALATGTRPWPLGRAGETRCGVLTAKSGSGLSTSSR